MTRKDYIALAAAIEPLVRESGTAFGKVRSGASYCEAIVRGIAEVLATDNPRFQRAKFMEACGIVGSREQSVAAGADRIAFWKRNEPSRVWKVYEVF